MTITDEYDTDVDHRGATRDEVAATPGNLVSDSLTMARRNLLRILRTPQIILFTVAGPIVFVVLFNVVFGGSIGTNELDYIDFLIPGVLIQTAVFDGTNTAVAIAQDLQRGSVDRFRSLPMQRSAVLFGRIAADIVRATFTAIVVTLIGLALGFRPSEGPLMLVAVIGLVVAFGSVFNWAYAYLGLLVKTPEAVESAGYLPIFPLVFAASTFAPVENMPDWMQPFAAHQPVTVTVDAARAMLHGGDVISALAQSAVWIVVLTVLFASASIRRFERM